MGKALIVAVGQECFKGRFLSELTSGPHEFYLLLSSTTRSLTSNWSHRYVEQEHIIYTDLRHPQKAARFVKEWAELRRITFDAVLTYLEAAVLVTQAIAEELSIPPLTTGEPAALRSKNKMRQKFVEAGLPQPRSILCRSLAEAKTAVHEVGLPCVFKPSQMAASVGVRKVCSAADSEIVEAYEAATNDDITEEDTRYTFNIAPEIVVEEYIPTIQEISCEGIVKSTEVRVIAITKKLLSDEPQFEEIGHITPFHLEDDVKQSVESQLRKGSRALKLHSTAFHAEFRLRSNSDPVLIEIGARLAGGFIPQLVQLSTGFNMLEASLRVAMGKEYDQRPNNRRSAAIRFFDDESNVKFAAAADQLRGLSFVEELDFYGKPGSGRRGHLIWTARTVAEIDDAWNFVNKIL